MSWNCDGFGAWPMWGMWVFPAFMFAVFALAAAAVFLGRGARRLGIAGPAPEDDATRSALQILNERFARGELSQPDYEARRAAIVATPS